MGSQLHPPLGTYGAPHTLFTTLCTIALVSIFGGSCYIGREFAFKLYNGVTILKEKAGLEGKKPKAYETAIAKEEMIADANERAVMRRGGEEVDVEGVRADMEDIDG